MLALVPQNEVARLKSLQSYRVLDTGPEEPFDNIVELAAMLTSSPIALVSLVDEERQWFKAGIGLDVDQMPREISFCSYTILYPCEPLIVEDALQDERFAENPLVTGEPGIRFYAGFSLLDRPCYCRRLCMVYRPRPCLASTLRAASSGFRPMRLKNSVAPAFGRADFVLGKQPEGRAMMGERTVPQETLSHSFNLDPHVPMDHLLRAIDRSVDLSAGRQPLQPYYSNTGRPSVDPERMIRIMLVGYCIGISSERRL